MAFLPCHTSKKELLKRTSQEQTENALVKNVTFLEKQWNFLVIGNRSSRHLETQYCFLLLLNGKKILSNILQGIYRKISGQEASL